MKKLSIIKHTYGIGNYPVITLNYHNDKKVLNFYPKEGMVDVNLVEQICEAIKNGYKVEYNDSPTVGDLK